MTEDEAPIYELRATAPDGRMTTVGPFATDRDATARALALLGADAVRVETWRRVGDRAHLLGVIGQPRRPGRVDARLTRLSN